MTNIYERTIYNDLEYLGYKINMQYQGEGQITYPSGKIKIGIFINSILQGPNGQIIFPDGQINCGTFINNKLYGYGLVKLPSGQIIEGLFNNSNLQGSVDIIINENVIKTGS